MKNSQSLPSDSFLFLLILLSPVARAFPRQSHHHHHHHHPLIQPVVVSHTSLVTMKRSLTDAQEDTAITDATPSNPVEIPRLSPQHEAKSVSLATFGATAVLLPVVTATVLPLSLVYQTGKYVASKITSSNSPSTSTPSLDTGLTPRKMIPRHERTYDIVVLGVTGFTGGLAARYLAQEYGTRIPWAMAGRNLDKLQKLRQQLADELNMPELITEIPLIVADTANSDTLHDLCQDTRAVATTAGPYSLYGNTVVEACAKYGTHYVDITGEVDWARSMIDAWQDTAVATGARLVPFCGHDSIPWDMVTQRVQEEFLKQFPNDTMESIVFWDEVHGSAPGGTIATIQTGIQGTAPPLPPIDRNAVDPMRRLPDGTKSTFKAKADLPSFIQPASSPWDSADTPLNNNKKKNTNQQRWTVPFIMAAINANIVSWSHALRQRGAPQLSYREMQVVPNFQTAFVTYFGQVMMGMMLFNPVTNSLLQKYVLPKPGEGPSMDKMLHKHYMYITAEGIGRQGNRVQSVLYFSKDVGCLETARLMVEAGLCLAQDEKKLPVAQGGFWTPSTGMGSLLWNRILNKDTKMVVQSFPADQSHQAKL